MCVHVVHELQAHEYTPAGSVPIVVPFSVVEKHVVGDVQAARHSLRNPAASVPQVFLPFAQSPRRDFTVVLRANRDPLSLAAQARSAIAEIDRTLPLDAVATMEEVVARIDTQNRFFMRIFAGLALIALVLAGVGVYGVTAYSVHQRTREIGIRMALGAQPGSLLLVVLKESAVLAGIGLALGLGAALGVVRFLASELSAVGASNAAGPITFVVVSTLLFAVAQLASFLPARRAARVDPVAALRNE